MGFGYVCNDHDGLNGFCDTCCLLFSGGNLVLGVLRLTDRVVECHEPGPMSFSQSVDGMSGEVCFGKVVVEILDNRLLVNGEMYGDVPKESKISIEGNNVLVNSTLRMPL